MASISKLMQVKIPAPKRSNFDLSRPNRMPIAPGLLYPVLVEEILPGDDIDLSISARLKSHPTLAPILGKFDCTYYHFFCPLHNYIPAMSFNNKQSQFVDEFDLPYFTVPYVNNSGEYPATIAHVGAGSLLDYLGFPIGMSAYSAEVENGVAVKESYNGVPLLCYYDIWRNYFANPQQENVGTYGGFEGEPDIDKSSIGFHSRLEWSVSQFDEVFSSLLEGVTDLATCFGSLEAAYYDHDFFEYLWNLNPIAEDTVERRNQQNSINSHAGLMPICYHDDMFVARLNTSYVNYVKSQVVVDTTSGSFSIDSLRMANKLAKFVDKTILGGTRYGQWLKSHFAVNGMEHLNIPIFLGMDRMSLYFDDVVSQAQTGAEDNGELGDVGGRASVNYPETDRVNFYAKEHGYLMTLVALRPHVEYFQGIPKMYQKTKFSDIYVPELDAVGWQPILAKDLYANTLKTTDVVAQNNFSSNRGTINTNRIVGYSPAWIEYMTSVGSAHGQFATSLDYWVNLRRFGVNNGVYRELAGGYSIDVDFDTYINPEDYNYAFAGKADFYDNFYLNQLINLYIKRNISKQILPSL